MLSVGCAQAQQGYVVTGTADGTTDGDTVYICSMQGFFAMVPEDTAVVKDGRFEFTGSTEGAKLRFLVPIHEKKATATTEFVLENANIEIHAANSDTEKDKVSGGESQYLWNQFEVISRQYNALMDKPWRQSMDSTLTKEEREKAGNEVKEWQNKERAAQKKFILEHVPSAFSDMAYGMYASEFSKEEQDSILKIFGEKQPQYPVYKQIMAERAATAATSIGKRYTDISLKGIDGKTVKVSSYVTKNRYTLIDFWASWCGPCRAEMPNVVRAYTLYHPKGFEVVGVSLDNNAKAWENAVYQLKMPWPQMSDLKGWDSEGAKLYNVKAIPANVLIDKQGYIVAKDLRGEELQNKLKELFQ